MTIDPAGAAALRRALVEAREIGLVGNDDPQRHLDHAAAFVAAAEPFFGEAGPEAFLDLGTGAGVPGLVLALQWPSARAVFLDAAQKRCAFVEHAIETLDDGLGARCSVRCGRAEELGRAEDLRLRFPLVVARSFGAPGVTAELGAPFVAPDGVLIVSEPPAGSEERWPVEKLTELGLGPASATRAGGFGVVVMRRVDELPDRYPRRTGVPGKRPLW